MVAELCARMLAANRSFYSLKNQCTLKNLPRRMKLGLYSTYIVPEITDATKTWTLSKSDETLLAALERRMPRKMLGTVCVEGQWRNRYNDELYEMYGNLTVGQRIKLARLRWTGQASSILFVHQYEVLRNSHSLYVPNPLQPTSVRYVCYG